MNTENLLLDGNEEALEKECISNYEVNFERHVKNWCDLCESSPCKCKDNSDEERERTYNMINNY